MKSNPGILPLSTRKNSGFVPLFTLAVLFIMQATFFLLPSWLIVPYNQIYRPLVYASLAAIVFVFLGRDERPVPKARLANLVSVVFAVFYFAAVLVAGIVYGFARNPMVSRFSIIAASVWTNGAVAFVSEYLRIQLIKGANYDKRGLIAVFCNI